MIVGISRLVPRKGFDTAIRAAARLGRTRPDLLLVIAGGGRDDDRLRRLATELDAPVRFLGRIPNDDMPRLYGCADVFTMLCRNRWGGLEQEGFGIVFVEAAACGVPQVAGDVRWRGRGGGRRCDRLRHRRPRGRAGGRPTRSPRCSTTRAAGRDGTRIASAVLVEEFTYDVLSRRLGETLRSVR